MGELRWKGTPISDLDDAALLDAIRRTLEILAAFWREVARRRLVRRV